MINHLPVFAPVLAIPLLLLALWKRDEKAIFIGAVLLMLAAGVGALLSTLTGEEAGEALAGEPGVSMMAMSEHEEYAEKTAIVMEIIALVAVWAGYVRFKSNSPTSTRWILILLASALISSAMAGGTALEGGKVRHPEIRPEQSMSDDGS
jgi:hypothetical protein